MALNEAVKDAEKGIAFDISDSRINSPIVPVEYDPALNDNVVLQWTKRVEEILGLEARGIHRVKANEQTPKTTLKFIHIVVLWFSINTAAQNITLASIGQEVYGLGFVDATLCSVFGGIVGSIPVAYTAGWGPWSGNRTLVLSKHPQPSTPLIYPRSVLASQWGGGLSRYVFCLTW